jgi:hypothetical protein
VIGGNPETEQGTGTEVTAEPIGDLYKRLVDCGVRV